MQVSLMACWGKYTTQIKMTVMMVVLSACDSATPNTPSDQSQAGTILIEASLSPILSKEQILDPEQCKSCHLEQYEEWSASMHAYASDDPVFLALNQKGQRETNGELGDFCVQCHAPMALRLGETKDGLNLMELPAYMRGVSCAFCHQVSEITGTHNNQLTWANDGVIRGPLKSLTQGVPHQSSYRPHFDRTALESSAFCGSCHDIVTPSELPIERTYWEWSQTIFNSTNPRYRNTCTDCHMPRTLKNVVTGSKRHSNHLMPGIDVHLSEHPGREIMLNAVKNELRYSLLPELCVKVGELGGAEIELTLENISAGHRFPSGASLDRRIWVELSAWSAQGNLLWSNGQVASTQPVSELDNIWLLRDQAFNEMDEPSHHLWEIERVVRNTLPGPQSQDQIEGEIENTHVLRAYRFGTEELVARVDLSVWVRPIALELLIELVESEDLSADVLEMMPTLEIEGASRVWLPEYAQPRITSSGRSLLCIQ